MCERYVTSCSGRQRRDGMSAWLSRPARLCVCRLPLSASALARMEEQDGADAGHPGRRAAPPVLGPVCEELDERHPSCSNLHGPREESDERHLSGPNSRVTSAILSLSPRERDRMAEVTRERAVVFVDESPKAVDILALLRRHCVTLTTLLRVTHFVVFFFNAVTLTSFFHKGSPSGNHRQRILRNQRDSQTTRRQLVLRTYYLS
jgi:hypothetical protein